MPLTSLQIVVERHRIDIGRRGRLLGAVFDQVCAFEYRPLGKNAGAFQTMLQLVLLREQN